MKIIVGLSVLSIILFIATTFLIWYLRKVLSKLLYVSENIGDFLIIIDNYAEHLDGIYNLEMFYGDETLQSMLKHTEAVLEEIEQFSAIYSLTTDLSEEMPDEEGAEIEIEEEEEEEESEFGQETGS